MTASKERIRSRRPKHGMVTAQEVADRAGVSLTTVSRVFRPNGIASSKTRELVRRVADELGYRPNIAARALASRRSHLLGLLVSNFDDPENLELFRFVSAEAQKRGYHAILLNIAQESSQIGSVDQALQHQVDGLLVSASHLPEELARRCAEQGKPIVIVGRKSRRPGYSSVYCDNADGARQVAEYLHELGCVRPAFIGGRPEATVTQERVQGFIARVEELYGYQPMTRMAGANDYDAGKCLVEELLAMPKPPDGFCCSSDLLAIGALDAVLARAGTAARSAIPVAGFGGTLLSKLGAYQLSTVAVSIEKMTRSATTHLIDLIEGTVSLPVETVFPCELVVCRR